MICASRKWLAGSLFFAMAATVPVTAQNAATPQDRGKNPESPVGDWRGVSVCQVRPSACRDEDSLYHVTPIAEKPGWFSMKADKIVDGKPQTMGTVECQYDDQRHSLECNSPRGALHFTLQGNKMEGTMDLPDKTLWRKISLKKVDS